MVRLSVVCIGLALTGLAVQGQAGASALEVASVVRNESGPGAQRVGMQPGGTLVVVNFPLRSLVLMAHRIQPSQLVGGPQWLRTERYDITARAVSKSSTVDAFGTALAAVLEERFKLKTHRETRELPVYELVLARADGPPGPGLTRVPAGCGSPQPDPTVQPRCNMNVPPGRFSGTGVTMAMLAAALGSSFDRVLVDRTGLTGWFDLALEWTPGLADAAATGPTLVTALREQLGLGVEPGRAEVDVVVIDSIEKPAAN